MLRGEKVVLRSLEREDLKRLHELTSNVDLFMLSAAEWAPVPLAALEKEFDKRAEGRDHLEFAIEADGKLIGTVGLHNWRNTRAGVGSFGIGIFDPEYVGKGYGRDALNVFLKWAFRVQNYRRIWLMTLADNERAIRAYEACGFVREGLLRQHEVFNGEPADVLVMGLLRDEWQARAS